MSSLLVTTAFAVALEAAPADTEALSRYRGFVLESSVAEVLGASGARAADVETVHTRPARIQQLEWRAPYVGSTVVDADPVRSILFAFHEGQLYQMTVTYHRERTEGLSTADLVAALTETYGPPVASTVRARAGQVTSETITLARWTGPDQSITLTRGSYAPDVQLIVRATGRAERAAATIREARALDTAEAPARQQEARDKALAEAAAAKRRNKPAFKP